MSLSKEQYKRWLKAAYVYYHGYGEDSGMSDFEWDFLGKQINPEEHEELRGTGYTAGQSLFWLSKNKYPDWAKEHNE